MKAKVKILGCGGSGGVPLVTGFWGACDPANPKNRRRRASILVETEKTALLVDTGPDFHDQTLQFGIRNIDAVLYTHAHADHVNGIDDLRYLSFIRKADVPVYADSDTLDYLRSRSAHLFEPTADGLYNAVLAPTLITEGQMGKPMDIAGVRVVPFVQEHGPSFRSLGFRFGDFAYSTDVSGLPEAAFESLAGVKTWLLDCAQHGSNFTVVHPNFDIVQAWNRRVGAARVILTHLTPRIDYATLAAFLPEGYDVAYDGMEIEINL